MNSAESDTGGAKLLQTVEFKAFVNKYVTAVNAKDLKALRSLYDPVSQAKMQRNEKEVTAVLNDEADDKIPAEHKVVVNIIGPKGPLPLLPMEDQEAVCPIRPTAFLQISYSTDSWGTTTSRTLFTIMSGDKWCQVWSMQPEESENPANRRKTLAMRELF